MTDRRELRRQKLAEFGENLDERENSWYNLCIALNFSPLFGASFQPQRTWMGGRITPAV